MSADRFRISSYALIGAWDRSDRLVGAVEDVYADIGWRGGVWLASGAFTEAWLEDAGASTVLAGR